MRKIESDILDRLKNKYGINKLRKVAELYGLGIPEKYWDTKPDERQMSILNEIKDVLKEHPNLIISGKSVLKSNVIGVELLKLLGNINHSRYLDFTNIANEMIDKFGQMNMNLLNELGNEDVIVISNIKSYGDYHISRVYPLFASFLDSLANSILSKKIILIMECEELDEIDKSYGNEMVKTMNELFHFYQLPIWMFEDEKN